MSAAMAYPADTLLLGSPQPVRHGLVDANDAEPGVDNGDQVRHGVEDPLPRAGLIEDQAAGLRTPGGGSPLEWCGTVRETRMRLSRLGRRLAWFAGYHDAA